MFAKDAQQPQQLPIRRRLKRALRGLRNPYGKDFGRSPLTAYRSLEFVWDPENNPEQSRLRRAAIVAGTVVAGGLGLALYGKRRGWMTSAPTTPKLLPNVHPPATIPHPALAPAPTPAAPVRKPAPLPSVASAKGGSAPPTPAVHAPAVANPHAKSKLTDIVKGLNKGKAPAPSVEDKGLVERIVRSEKQMKSLPERVRRAISRLHEQARNNPTKGGRVAAQETLDKVLDKHGLTRGHLLVAHLREIQFARGDQTRKLLWPVFPRWWKGVLAVPARGSEEAAKLAGDVRGAYRGKGDVYGRMHTHWAQQGLLRGVTTSRVKGLTRTWQPATLDARLKLTEFFADKLIARAKKAFPMVAAGTVEAVVPGGTAINAAGIAGVRTAIHLRRILRKRYGAGMRGLTQAALTVSPGEAAGIMSEATTSGVRDSRAFVRKSVRSLPRAVSRVLNKRMFAAQIPAIELLHRIDVGTRPLTPETP